MPRRRINASWSKAYYPISPPLEREWWYQTRQKAVYEALGTRDLRGARVLAEDMEDPYWRSTMFSAIARVTRQTQDFEAARTAAREIGVSWWRSVALASLVDALAKVRGFAAANAALEETEDFLCRDVARKHIAKAEKR